MADELAQQLSIKVKVDLPTAGELENKLNRSLQGLKDIKANVKVNAKIGKLSNLKRQLREAIGNQHINAKVGVKVTGEAQLKSLARQIERVRRLAQEPINMKVGTGNKGIDSAVENAERKMKGLKQSFAESTAGIRAEARRYQKEINSLAKEQVKAQTQALKANDEQLRAYHENRAREIAEQQRAVEKQYREYGVRKRLSGDDISASIVRARRTPKQDDALGLARVNREIRTAKNNWSDYKRAINEAYSAEQKLATKTLGRNETAALQTRAKAYREEASAINLSNSYRQKAARLAQDQRQSVALIQARQRDGVYERLRPRTRARGGIVPTMDIGGALQTGVMGVAAVISQLNAVDKAITKVTKVVPDSQTAVNKWKKNIYRDAAEVGKTAPEFASAVEQWATAGYNLKQSNRLAKTSVMGSFVGEVPVNDMVRYMAVPLKAFQKEGLKSVDIVNAMNQVSNKHAIEMDDLGQAYQKASATMGATGTTFAQMTGIITAAQEGTRAGGDQIGTAFKTISANLAQVGSGITKQAQNKNKFFEDLGVQLKDSKGNLKSTYQIMDQLSKKWKTMSKQDKNTASLYAAGKNHANIFSATMDNWDTAKKAMREAEDQKGLGSSGSAYQEMAKQKQSIEFQLKGLQDIWGEFLQNLSGGREGIGQVLGLLSSFGNGLVALSSNKMLSSTARWATLAGGVLMARRAFSGLTASLAGTILEGKKGDSMVERLTGLSSKTSKWKSSLDELKKSWGELKGTSDTPASSTKGTISKSSSTDKDGFKTTASFGNETAAIQKNTEAHSSNQKERKKVTAVAENEGRSTQNFGNALQTESTALEKNSQKVVEHGSKLRRFGNVARASFGMLSAGLGYVGLGLDAITLTGAVLNAMGVHPIQALQRVMDPAGESAKQFGKYIDKVGSSVTKTGNAIEKNGIVTGRISNSMKAISDMQKSLPQMATQDGKYVGDDFENLKKNFNEISKQNGLELRIRGGENVDQVNQKMQALNDNMQQVKKESAEDLGDKVSKNLSNLSKLTSAKTFDKLLKNFKGYRDELEKDYSDVNTRDAINGQLEGTSKPKKAPNPRDYEYGEKNAALWNSAQGRKISKAVSSAQRSIRDAIDGMASNIQDGTLTEADIKSLDRNGQQVAALGLMKNLSSLRGTDDGDKDKSNASSQLSSLLQSMGASQKAADKLVGLYSKQNSGKENNAQIMRAMKSAGIDKNMIASVAGISAQYMQQHMHDKGGYLRSAIKDQGDYDKYVNRANRKGNKLGHANADALIDPNTGYINYQKIASFNATKGFNKDTQEQWRLGRVGINTQKKHSLSVGEMLNATTGLDGDPTKILSAIENGKATARQAIIVANNQHSEWKDNGMRVGGTGATKQEIVKAAASQGSGRLKENSFNSTINDLVADGQLTQEQGDAAIQYRSRHFDKNGNATDVTGAKDLIGNKKLTEDAFKKYAKNLDSDARKQLAKELNKKKQLTDKQKKDLDKDFNKKGGKKKPSKSKEKDKDDGIDRTKRSSKKSQPKTSNLKVQKSAMLPTSLKDLKNFGGKDSAFYKLTHSNFGKNFGNMFGKIGNGFKKGGLLGGMFNLGKMTGAGLQKMLFGKQLNLGSMFKGKNNPMNGLRNMFSGAKKMFTGKNNPFNGLKNMFKGKNNPFSGLKNMFSGKNNPLSKLFGGKGKKLKLNADTKGISKSLKNLGGKKGTKVKLQADTKGLSKSLKNLGGKKGAKVKLQADTKSLGKSLKNLGGKKGTKIKLQADTKGLTKSIQNIGGKKGAKIKLQADTRSLSKSIKGLGKGKTNKIKVTADVSSAKSRINSLKNTVKSVSRGNNKIKVTANVSSAKSQINSLKNTLRGLNRGNNKIKVTATVSGKGQVASLKSAINGLHSKKVKVSASASGTGAVNSLKTSINGVHSKTVKVSASVSGTGQVRALSAAINSVHSKHVKVSASVSGIGEVRSLASAIAAVHSKSVTVSATKIETTIKKTKSGSVAISPQQATENNPLKSMAVVVNNPVLSAAVNSSVNNMGVDENSAMNGQKVTDYSDSTQNVNEDYWRYMGNQLYTGLPLDEQVQKLEGAVTQADENMDKLISLARQRIDVDNKQIAYQQTMQRAYQQEVSDMIAKLRGFGFRANGNQITNLNHAKDIHGDNASKVDEYLGKYQTAYQNLSEATQKISELQTDIWQQNKNQEDYRNTKDQKMVEQLQRSLEILTTSIDNHKNIQERQANSLSDDDYIMRAYNSNDQIHAKSEDVYQLLQKFNELSVANFVGTKDADNAKNLLESLQSIRDTITDNLDAIEELRNTIRDIQLNSIIENLSRFTENLNDNIDRLKNNVTNLQDGLLSGTTYSDLMSSNFDEVNLDQRSAYARSVNDRIELEKQLDDALDAFAKKNVDRTAQVANQQLQINYQMYDELTKMAESYATSTMIKIEPIRVQYEPQGNSDKLEIEGVTHNRDYVNASLEYQRKMNDLKAEYNYQMAIAGSQEEKELLNQEMVFKQLSLQEDVYKKMIEADRQAIADLKRQAENPEMTTEQRKTISNQITEYEKNIIDAQNNIKEAIKGRFDYEKSLLDKQVDSYKRLTDVFDNLVTIADALHLDGKTQAAVIDQQYAATYLQYDNYLSILEKLRNELGKYEKGSFERNQLQDMINDYQTSLDSTVNTLLEITKNELGQNLDAVQREFEKSVNKGMTAGQAKFDQDVWYNPMQKELKLEEMRLKITELEDKTVEKRIAALDAQERMSKAEADYVDKQLDLALAQQKLNNTINKKDVRYLEKDENGKFNWTYVADQDSVDAARQEVNKAKQALEDAKVSNRNDYIQKVEEIVSNIKDGSINQEEVRSRLEQLNNSYKFILKDIPTFDISKVEDILKAYNNYEAKNQDILNDYHRNANVANKQSYADIIKGFGDQFKAVSKDLGEIFGKELRETLNLPDGIRNAYGTGKDNSFVIQNLKLELPNVHDANDFAEAIRTLPQVAKQQATVK